MAWCLNFQLFMSKEKMKPFEAEN
ncbi:uncharacterized protein G2W53_004777 [Senna tora]|uniref:Uncharacterized protein n=1 Tax=Senna tora TaxID=362788 RepID=A0A834XDQ9_9FABA|nr:uncharacterized protein G2W53_004777 [Senna tora]